MRWSHPSHWMQICKQLQRIRARARVPRKKAGTSRIAPKGWSGRSRKAKVNIMEKLVIVDKWESRYHRSCSASSCQRPGSAHVAWSSTNSPVVRGSIAFHDHHDDFIAASLCARGRRMGSVMRAFGLLSTRQLGRYLTARGS